jgi:hypothetical protein
VKSTAARTVVVIIGGLAVLVGGVWIGQGAGLIKGSFYDRQCNLAGHRTAVSGRRLVLDLLGLAAALQPERAR